MTVHKDVVIKGFVHKVAYRRHAQRVAKDLGVKGWVRNLPDGNVEACLEGEESSVDALLAWCAFGPKYGRVDEVLISSDQYSGTYADFTVIEDQEAA